MASPCIDSNTWREVVGVHASALMADLDALGFHMRATEAELEATICSFLTLSGGVQLRNAKDLTSMDPAQLLTAAAPFGHASGTAGDDVLDEEALLAALMAQRDEDDTSLVVTASNFNELPRDLQAVVFQYLDTPTVVSSALLVCRDWLSLTVDARAWKDKYVALHRWPPRLFSRLSCTSTFRLATAVDVTLGTSQRRVFKDVVRYWPRLREVRVASYHAQLVRRTLKDITEMETLVAITGRPVPLVPKLAPMLARRPMRKLSLVLHPRIELEASGFGDIVAVSGETLTHLALGQGIPFDAALFPALQSLELWSTEILSMRLPQLTSLHLTDMRITDEDMEEYGPRLPQLTTLVLDACTGWNIGLHHFEGIRSLTIRDCESFGAHGYGAISALLPGLKELAILGHDAEPEEFLPADAVTVQLERLRLTGDRLGPSLRGLTPASMETLRRVELGFSSFCGSKDVAECIELLSEFDNLHTVVLMGDVAVPHVRQLSPEEDMIRVSCGEFGDRDANAPPPSHHVNATLLDKHVVSFVRTTLSKETLRCVYLRGWKSVSAAGATVLYAGLPHLEHLFLVRCPRIVIDDVLLTIVREYAAMQAQRVSDEFTLTVAQRGSSEFESITNSDILMMASTLDPIRRGLAAATHSRQQLDFVNKHLARMLSNVLDVQRFLHVIEPLRKSVGSLEQPRKTVNFLFDHLDQLVKAYNFVCVAIPLCDVVLKNSSPRQAAEFKFWMPRIIEHHALFRAVIDELVLHNLEQSLQGKQVPRLAVFARRLLEADYAEHRSAPDSGSSKKKNKKRRSKKVT